MEIILKIISIFDTYANSLLVLLTLISIFYIRKEFFLKRRPFIDINIILEEKNNNWYFYVSLINKGTYPGVIKIDKAITKIGDEIYPTQFNHESLISQNEIKKLFPIGHINENGINKIRGHEYKINRVEIEIKCLSKSIGDKKYNYETSYIFEVDVHNDKPLIKIISENIK